MSAETEEPFAGRFNLEGRSLRTHTARGSVVNAVFVIATNLVAALKGFLAAALITPSEYGVWGILVVTLVTVTWLKSSAIGDKYIQQNEGDQEVAFQRAFTLELLLSGALLALFLAALPLAAAAYGRPSLIAPGLALALVIPASVFATPLWVFYRRMQFVRQRLAQALDPVISLVVTVALAAAGAGYWSFVVGVVVGAWATAAMAVAMSPYRLRLHLDHDSVREYLAFSWPVFVAGLSGLGIAQGALLIGQHTMGAAAVGAIALASTITTYAERVDGIITATLYPAICAVADRTELLLETFIKSNRLALMWSLPFGVGMALFAADLVEFGLGDRWDPAVVLLQVFGLATALYQVGFNWSAFFMARGQTRPAAVVGVATLVAFLGAAIPMSISWGIDGFAAGMAVSTVVNFAGRTWFLTRMFHGFGMLRHLWRAAVPVVLPAVLVLALRQIEPTSRSLGMALAELALFCLTTAAATLLFERRLLHEVRGYLGRGTATPTLAGR